jgi:di/tricarboxylate transporter
MSIVDITKAKLPFSIAIMLLAIFVIPKFCPDTPLSDEVLIQAKQDEKEPLTPLREFVGYATFVCVLFGLLFSGKIGLQAWQVCFIGALVVVAFGVLDKKETITAMNMSMVLLYVGCLAIGNALSATGAADVIGNALAGMVQNINNNYLIGLLLFIVPFVLTQFMLNLGVYSIFVPLYIMLCKSMGANPIGPIMLCMMACMTAYFTPLATPAVPVMMAAGNYKVKDLLKMGWVPFIVITVVAVGWTMTVYPII